MYRQSSFSLSVGFLLITCCSCSEISQNKEPLKQLETLAFKISYIDSEKNILTEHNVNKFAIFFTAIKGEIFGPRKKQVIIHKMVHNGQELTYEAKTMADKFDSFAGEMLSGENTVGLTIAPVETRLYRVGTYAYDPSVKRGLGATVFIDVQSKTDLMLVYFDRACHLSGTLIEGTEQFVHDIKIPAGGFYWLSARKTKPNVTTLQAYKHTENVIFAIYSSQD